MKKFMVLGLALIFSFSAFQALALFYDFEDEAQLDDWELFGPAEWTIEDGALICDGPGGDGALVPPEAAGSRQNQRLELKDVVFSDGEFEFKIKFIQGINHEGGVYYRWQDTANWYNVHPSLKTCGGGNPNTVRWMVIEDGVLIWTPEDIQVDQDECFERWIHFKVIVDGDHHLVFVDGEEKYDVTDNAFDEGKFVIGTWSNSAEKWAIDDVNIEGKGISGAVSLKGKLTTVWGGIKTQ